MKCLFKLGNFEINILDASYSSGCTLKDQRSLLLLFHLSLKTMPNTIIVYNVKLYPSQISNTIIWTTKIID